MWSYKKINGDDSSMQEPKDGDSLENTNGDSNQDVSLKLKWKLSSTPGLLFIAATTFATILFLTLGFSWIQISKSNTSRKDSLGPPCGNSAAEAIASGCTFDHLTWAWYPPYCPHYSNDLFLNAEPGNPFKYFHTLEDTDPVSGENWTLALDNQFELWTERREHLTHCVYLFLSLGQIVRDSTPFVPILADNHHMEHCAEFLLEALRSDSRWNDRDTHVGDVRYDQDC